MDKPDTVIALPAISDDPLHCWSTRAYSNPAAQDGDTTPTEQGATLKRYDASKALPSSYNNEDWQVDDIAVTFLPDGSKSTDLSKAELVEVFWTTARTFHPFPQLPVELRRKIWKHALPGPRTVTLGLFTLGFGRNAALHTFLEGWDAFDAGGLITACQESNKVFSENYHKIVISGPDGTPWQDNGTIPLELSANTSPRGRIDGKRDTLIISSRNLELLEMAAAVPNFTRINHLGLSRETRGMGELAEEAKDTARNEGFDIGFAFPNLKTFTRIIGRTYSCLFLSVPTSRCLLDIDEDFAYSVCNSWCGQQVTLQKSLPTESKMIHYASLARKLREDPREYPKKFSPTSPKIEMRVAMVASQLSKQMRDYELLYLSPRKPEFHGISHYTIKEKTISYSHEFLVAELQCRLGCSEDGTLFGRYDNLDRLFEEVEDIEEVKKAEVVNEFEEAEEEE